MAVSQTSDGFALPCGRQLETLWDRLDEAAPDRHEQSCPHCRTALASLATLREATRELAAEPVAVPQRLAGRVMAAVRAEARRARTMPLPVAGPEPGDQAEISEQAVAAVLRFAADSVPGIRARRCRVRPSEEGRGGEPGLIDVEMTVAVRYGTSPVHDALAAVRRAVQVAADASIGLRVARCDLYVEDVYQ